MWQSISDLHLTELERYWLGYEGSLTQKIRDFWGAEVEVQVVSSGLQSATADEALILEVTNSLEVFCREVILAVSGQQLVSARSVCAPESWCGSLSWLSELGASSLGSLLFDDNTTWLRGSIDVCRNDLLTRRSLFRDHNGAKIIVQESFLPAFWQAQQ